MMYRIYNRNNPLRVAVPLGYYAPFETVITHSNGTIEAYGSSLDILDCMARYLNISYKIVAADVYGTVDENGTWTGIIGSLQRNESDLGVGMISITYLRTMVVEFLQPFAEEAVTFAVPIHRADDFYSVFLPLHLDVWLSIAAIITAISLLVTFFEVQRFSDNESEYGWANERVMCMKNARIGKFLAVMKVWIEEWILHFGMVQMKVRVGKLRRVSSNIIMMSWWMVCIVISSAYTGNFVAFLSIERVPPYPDTIHKLATSNLSIAMIKGIRTIDLLQNSKNTTDMYKLWQIIENDPNYPENLYENNKELLTPSNSRGSAKIMVYRYMKEYVLNNTDYGPSKELITNDAISFAVQKNFPFIKDLNKVLLRIIASGLISTFEKRHLTNPTVPTSTTRKQTTRPAPFTLDKMAGVAVIVLGTGLSLSAMVFLCEMSAGKYLKKTR